MQYQSLLKTELQEVKALMLDAIDQVPHDISHAISTIINGRGKQLRPSLVLLSSHICHAQYKKACYAAAAVEMLHTATLIHDDLIDNSFIRRGFETLNANFPPAITVLSGDITFAIAAKFAAKSDNVLLVNKFASTLETICEGEINQLLTGHNRIPTFVDYYDRIYAKTASLFSLCTEAGAILAECSPEQAERARSFGHLLGLAFQIADDVLDFMGSESILGKPVGGDLKEGLITLPILYYYQQHPADARIEAILNRDIKPQEIEQLVTDLRRSDVAHWAMQEAKNYIDKALILLMDHPPTLYRDAMEEIAKFAIQRRY